MPEDQADSAQAAYRADARVASASLDKVRTAESGADDPSYGDQWALPRIGWEDVHGVVAPAGQSTLAVLDTGVDASAPDLAGRVVGGWSYDGSDPALDPNGHGTHMATIAAGGADDGTGIAGVAYAGVNVMPVRVLDADGTGQDSDIIEGLVYAVDHGANVVLMAFSNPGQSAALQAAIDYAWSNGVVVVAAAGNDGSTTPTYPAGLAQVVGAGATDESDAVWGGSNQSDAVFIAAPGVSIAASDSAGVTSVTGTSASAAVVAGAAALLRRTTPRRRMPTIVGRLARNTDATTGGVSGNGRVNLARAIGDTSTDGVTPAGAPGGGPVVGPYVLAATDGDGAMTVAPLAVLGGATTQTLTFDFWQDSTNTFNSGSAAVLTVPAGWTAPQITTPGSAGYTTVVEGSGNGTNSCNPGTVTIGGSGPWTITIPMTCGQDDHLTITYGSGGTVTAPATVQLYTFTTQSRDGATGLTNISTSPTVRTLAVDTFADAALTTPQTVFGSGATVYLRVRGLPASQSDFSVAWIKSGVDCTNTGGTGRPDTTSGGQLPSGGGGYLQYPPGASGDNWNLLSLYETQTCPALSGSNLGTWSLELTHSSIGTVTLPAFTNVDTTAPTVSSINRAGTDPTNAASVSWTVTFSETVTGVDAGDFSLATTGVSGASITSVTGTGPYTATVNTGTGNGTIGLNLVDNDTIADTAGNLLGAPARATATSPGWSTRSTRRSPLHRRSRPAARRRHRATTTRNSSVRPRPARRCASTPTPRAPLRRRSREAPRTSRRRVSPRP